MYAKLDRCPCSTNGTNFNPTSDQRANSSRTDREVSWTDDRQSVRTDGESLSDRPASVPSDRPASVPSDRPRSLLGPTIIVLRARFRHSFRSRRVGQRLLTRRRPVLASGRTALAHQASLRVSQTWRRDGPCALWASRPGHSDRRVLDVRGDPARTQDGLARSR